MHENVQIFYDVSVLPLPCIFDSLSPSIHLSHVSVYYPSSGLYLQFSPDTCALSITTSFLCMFGSFHTSKASSSHYMISIISPCALNFDKLWLETPLAILMGQGA